MVCQNTQAACCACKIEARAWRARQPSPLPACLPLNTGFNINHHSNLITTHQRNTATNHFRHALSLYPCIHTLRTHLGAATRCLSHNTHHSTYSSPQQWQRARAQLHCSSSWYFLVRYKRCMYALACLCAYASPVCLLSSQARAQSASQGECC